MDTVSIAKLNQLHPALRNTALAAYHEAVVKTPKGVHPIIDDTLRTFDRSDRLYQVGRTLPGKIISNAKAGESWHNYGLAIDWHLVVNGKDVWPENLESAKKNKNWMKVANIFKEYGFNWGGDFEGIFKDVDHVENKLHQTIGGLLTKYKAGDFIKNTNYVNF